MHSRFMVVGVVLVLLTDTGFAARDERGTLVDTPDGNVYIEVLGSGGSVPLVVINGGPGFDHAHQHIAQPGVQSVWDTLSARQRVVLYDQRGTGRSTVNAGAPCSPGTTCTLESQIADLESVRRHLGVEMMSLLGHSWGGFVAMAYGARHPSRVSRMILVDSAAAKFSDTRAIFADVFPESYERAMQFVAAQQKGDPTARASVLREYVTWLFYSPEKRDGYIPQLAMDGENNAINTGLQQQVRDLDLSEDVRKFTFPSLIITGRYDMNIIPAIAYGLHKQIPGSRFVVFERSGHAPYYEEPEAFLRTVEQFLSDGR